jgi:hypothetical protein
MASNLQGARILQELVLFGVTIQQLQLFARLLYAPHHGDEGISLAAALRNRHIELLLAFRVSRGQNHLKALRIYDGSTQGVPRDFVQQKCRVSTHCNDENKGFRPRRHIVSQVAVLAVCFRFLNHTLYEIVANFSGALLRNPASIVTPE